MSLYSHSQLSTYEQCPLRYKLRYRDRIKREVTGIEAFLGIIVHETLRRCYNDALLGTVSTPMDLFTYYDELWERKWHDEIVITRNDISLEDYRAQGKTMLVAYHQRYAPFNSELTIGTEMKLTFSLKENDNYMMVGFIDRLSRTKDGIHQIHDYKTSSHLPLQEEIDQDRQLGLYSIGIKQKWPNIEKINLIWHYLAFDRELISHRSDEDIRRLIDNTTRLIDEINDATDFPPRESALCSWCEYPDLCPLRKHLYGVDPLPRSTEQPE
jgi:putative RecB family exonuclease